MSSSSRRAAQTRIVMHVMGSKASSKVHNGTQPHPGTTGCATHGLGARSRKRSPQKAEYSDFVQPYHHRSSLLRVAMSVKRCHNHPHVPACTPPSPRDGEIASHLHPLNGPMMHTSHHVSFTRKRTGQRPTHVYRRRPLRRNAIVRSSRAQSSRVIYPFINTIPFIHPSSSYHP